MRGPTSLGCALLVLTTAAQHHKVLIIGIDGCRGDAMLAANCPTLDSLAAAGLRTFEANTHPPTWSATGWTTMLTGVWEQKHKAVENSFTGNQIATWPHFFARIRAARPELRLHSIVHWGPVNDVITTQADQETTYPTDQQVADAAVTLLQNGDPDVLFLHFDDVDHAGHGYGFTPGTAEYLAAIEGVDTKLRPILRAVRQRPADEQWAVLVSTDHGGVVSGHGGVTFDEQRTFTFVSGPGILPQERMAAHNTVTPPNAIAFTSSTHARVTNTAPYQFGATQDFTLECRVKLPSTWSGDPAFISNKNWNSGVNTGWVLSTTGSGYNWKFNIGDGTDRVDLTGLPINDGQWHHLAVTCDRDGEARIFQDGVLLRSASMAAIGDVNTALQLCFGQDGTTTYAYGMAGTMSDVRIWDKALDINTVSAWSGMDLDNGHPDIAHLIGYWRMHDGAGGILGNEVPGAPTAQYYSGASPSSATWNTNTLPLTTTDLSRTPAQVDLVPTVLAYLCIANDPAWQLDGRSLIPACAPVQVAVRTLLDGPYDDTSGLMSDSLRAQGLVPQMEPYTGLGFTRAMVGGNEVLSPTALNATGPNAVVDWVLLEQRDGSDPARVVATRSALVQRDGDVVELDGISTLRWPVLTGAHYLSVRHRNHLGAMTAAPVTFTPGATTAVDLTSPSVPVYGTNALRTRGGVRTQWSGNVNTDNKVRYTGLDNDRDPILVRIGGLVPTNTASGYVQEDVTLDGVVKYTGQDNDRDPVLISIGGTVPTATRTEQLP